MKYGANIIDLIKNTNYKKNDFSIYKHSFDYYVIKNNINKLEKHINIAHNFLKIIYNDNI